MHLIYLDESGNSGNNLNDAQQPVFVLCAIIVNEERWRALESDLQESIFRLRPAGIPGDFEVHGSDIRTGHGSFKGMRVAERIVFRDEWLKIAAKHDVRVIYRAIHKRRYADYLEQNLGQGVLINPHVVAFALIAKVVNDYLRSLPGQPLGLFISDENREITPDIEKSIRFLRGSVGPINLGQIVEKGFFIDSRMSLPLQLCDIIALTLRKYEEVRQGLLPAKSIDDGAYSIVEPLLHRGDAGFVDAMAWLLEVEKKKRPGNKS